MSEFELKLAACRARTFSCCTISLAPEFLNYRGVVVLGIDPVMLQVHSGSVLRDYSS